jgi:hypothetical protein
MFFALGFFHELSSTQHLKITLWPFQIFSKIPGDIRKSRCTTGGYQRDRWKNLPTVSTIHAVFFATDTAGVVDTGGKFAIGVNDNGSKFAGGK